MPYEIRVRVGDTGVIGVEVNQVAVSMPSLTETDYCCCAPPPLNLSFTLSSDSVVGETSPPADTIASVSSQLATRGGSLLGHPLRDRLMALRLRNHAGDLGVSDAQMDDLPDDVLLGAADLAASRVERVRGLKGGTILSAIGAFLANIADWLKSPDGQAFLAELAKILLALLAGA